MERLQWCRIFYRKKKGGGRGATKIWLSFGKNEVDAVWIWNRLCDQIADLGSPLADRMRGVNLPKSRYEINQFMQMLQPGFDHPVYLILDDCNECDSEEMDRLLEYVAYERIPNLHIMMLSRTYPKIQYEEMWMKGCCASIGQSMLALRREEILEFFRMNDINLSGEECGLIYEYTEGWMSAIYLVLLDYRKCGRFRKLGGINRLIRNFIYDKLSQEEKDVMMRLSLLDSFFLDQAVYITEKASCSVILPRLAEYIDFVKYDSEAGNYKFHSVLRSVLNLELEQSGIDKKEIYKRCAKWLEQQDQYIHAIRYYKDAGCAEQIFRMIEKYHCNVLFERAPNVIKDFFDWAPKEMKWVYPIAYFSYIEQKIIHDDNILEGRQLYHEAKEYYQTHACQELSAEQIKAELYLVEWNLEFNDLEKMLDCAKKASELMGNQKSLIFHQDNILTYGAVEILFLYHNKVGGLRRTIALEKQYTAYYMRLVNGYEGGWDQLLDAEYYFTIGELDQAEQLAQIASQKAVIRDQACVIISSYFLRLRNCIHYGQVERFKKLMLELREKMAGECRNTIRMDYEIAVGYLCGCIGRMDKIASWLNDFDLKGCSRIMRSTRTGCVVYGQCLLKREEWVRLENLADEMSIPYSTSKHVMVLIYSALYYAVAAYHLYGAEKGKEYLEAALRLAEPDAIIMPFVEYIDYIEPFLALLAKTSAFAARILQFGQRQKKGIRAFREEHYGKDKMLTEREQVLMQLVAQGYKNTEICREMNLALVTVEKKLTVVYRKVGVSNRVAAIEKLRELHELS